MSSAVTDYCVTQINATTQQGICALQVVKYLLKCYLDRQYLQESLVKYQDYMVSRLYAQTITRQSPQMFCAKSGGELDFIKMVHDLKIDTTITLSQNGNSRIWHP